MKKILISAILPALLLGTSAFASDTQSLTKATVKLIKYHNETNVQLNIINYTLGELKEKDSSTDKEIANTNQNVASNSEEINKANEKIKFNGDKIKNITKDITTIKTDAKKALFLSEETRKILDTVTSISNEVKESNSKIEEDKNHLISLNKDMNVSISSLSKSNQLQSEKITDIMIKLEDLENRLSVLERDFSNHKVEANGRYNELKESLKSFKIFYEAELNVLKAKLDRSKPVLINSVPSHSGCLSKDCENKVEKSEELLIEEFLK